MIFATLAIGSIAMPLERRPARGQAKLAGQAASGRPSSSPLRQRCSFFWRSRGAAGRAPARLFALFLLVLADHGPGLRGWPTRSAMRQHLPQPYEEFSGVRLWGTAGWMVVGWLVSLAMSWNGAAAIEEAVEHARSPSGSPQAAGPAQPPLYCLFVDATVEHPAAWPLRPGPGLGPGPAPRCLSRGDPAVSGMSRFLLTALGVHLTTPFVYQVLPTYLESRGLPRAWISTALTLGQWPEIAMLALLPWLLRRFGPRVTLALGIGAWVSSVPREPGGRSAALESAVAGDPAPRGSGLPVSRLPGRFIPIARHPASEPARPAPQAALPDVVTAGIGSFFEPACWRATPLAQVRRRLRARLSSSTCVIDSARDTLFLCVGFGPAAHD